MSSQTNKQINAILNELANIKIDQQQGLLEKQHEKYMQMILADFRQAIIYFDVAQPWLYYYCVHSLNLLGVCIPIQTKVKIQTAIQYCFNKGYAGGYKQVAHLAPTYASFLTLLSLGKQYVQKINKQKLLQFFYRVKKNDRFMMHQYGQCDIRGTYIVAIIVKYLKLDEKVLEGAAENILRSQTPEGGISNTIGGQAHGGFTFCGVAALAIMGRLHQLDVSKLIFWLSRRQVEFGGFNGRTNKLIDSCYSFWIGSTFNLVNDYFEKKISWENHLLYSQKDLQKYILLYCQQKKGGLVDKPGKSRDCYHTCYSLSGLSLSQQYDIVLNDSKLKQNDPIYNVLKQKLQECRQN